MERLYIVMQRLAAPFLRISLGIVLLWIGALMFVDPTPVVGLLQASLPFLASNTFVYLLGVLEVLSALTLFSNIRHAELLQGDMATYTDIKPVIQVSQVEIMR